MTTIYRRRRPKLCLQLLSGSYTCTVYNRKAPLTLIVSTRIMPEVPENMQENIAYLELEANQSRTLVGLASPASQTHNQPPPNAFPPRTSSYQQAQPPSGAPPATPTGPPAAAANYPARHSSISSTYKQPPSVAVQPVQIQVKQSHDYNQFANAPDLPN